MSIYVDSTREAQLNIESTDLSFLRKPVAKKPTTDVTKPDNPRQCNDASGFIENLFNWKTTSYVLSMCTGVIA
jgi:hypothetical protein